MCPKFYHRKPVVRCRHTGRVDCVQCTVTFVCFQEIKVLQTSTPSLSMQSLLNLWRFSILPFEGARF